MAMSIKAIWKRFCDSPAQDGDNDARNDEIEDEEEGLSPEMQVEDGVGNLPFLVGLDHAGT